VAKRGALYGPRLFTVPDLEILAASMVRDAAGALALARQLRDAADSLRCGYCDVQIAVPTDSRGRLLAGEAYGTHTLDCPSHWERPT
jgi:hypothetical protein